MTILGLDPGIANLGYALVSQKNKRYQLHDHGCIRTKPKTELGVRLQQIYWELITLIDKCDAICVETVFFSRNVKSAMNIAKVIGLTQLIAANDNKPFIEVRPAEAKATINCDNKSTKKEIISKVNEKFKTEIKNDHIADALCISIAGFEKLSKQK